MSIIRYPGGKTRAISSITPYLPKGGDLYSPFFGGGSIELHMCRAHGTRVHANDVNEPLVNFWRCMKCPRGREGVLDRVQQRLPMTKALFRELKAELLSGSPGPLDRAAAFFLVCAASFNGGALSAGYSAHNALRIPRLMPQTRGVDLSLVDFTCSDYLDFLRNTPREAFLFLDPPYDITSPLLYGHNGDAHAGFDHAALRQALDGRSNWVLCYNDTPYIRRLYHGYEIVPLVWYHSLRRGAGSNNAEVIIMPRAYYVGTAGS